MKIYKNYCLKPINTFRINCFAKRFFNLYTKEDVKKLIIHGEFKNDDKIILGGGSNILFTKETYNSVLHPQFRGIEVLYEDEKTVKIKIGAGEIWDRFVKYSVGKRWFGIENLAHIPGLVGAAPIQNIGAYGVELKNVFVSLRAINIETGELNEFSKNDCEFDYRTSIFKTRLKDKFLIYDICLRLFKSEHIDLSYQDLQSYFIDTPKDRINQKAVFNAVTNIRKNKLPDPNKLGNAGSFFKNPVISETEFSKLKKEFPDIIGYKQNNDSVKLAAGWLIEKLGYKGIREGDIGVHNKQALIIVNHGNAKGKDIFDFSERICQSVNSVFGVKLEREVNIL